MLCSHSGDCGDLIYALPAIKDAAGVGGAELTLFPASCTGFRMNPERAESLQSLLEIQPYIRKVEWAPGSVGINLDGWRCQYRNGWNLADMVSSWLSLPLSPREVPWLVVDHTNPVAEVVFCRSPRYRNHRVPWRRIWEQYSKGAVFVGLEEEYNSFCHDVGTVPYYATSNFLEVARVLSGSKLVCCNQSCPRAIAEGLKLPVVVEVGSPNNTHFDRPKAVYMYDHRVDLPQLAIGQDWQI